MIFPISFVWLHKKRSSDDKLKNFPQRGMDKKKREPDYIQEWKRKRVSDIWMRELHRWENYRRRSEWLSNKEFFLL